MKTNLYTSDEAREKLMKGIKRASEAVSVTMGSSGSNAILEDIRNPGFFLSNDGSSILERTRFEDPLEELGRRILYEVVKRSEERGGDGSSTATLLAASILEEGMKHIGKVSPMEIKRSLEDCIPIIEKSLKAQRKELVDSEGNIDFKLLEQTATISAEDESIGKMIAEIYKKIGKDGIVNWEISKSGNDFFEVGTGIKMDETTYATRWMCDDAGGGPGTQAILQNPYVLLAQSKITTEKEIENVFQDLVGQGIKELVIFCDEIEEPVLSSLTRARLPNSQGGVGFRFLVIKMPVVFNDLWWEDLALASGGRLINRASGIKMKDVGIEMLGKFGKITATPTEVFIDGIQDLTKHTLALKVEGTEMSLARAARLNTKTARYFVGGHSDSSVAYRRLKIEDSINSAWCAMQNGILPGGGVALLEIGSVMNGESTIGKNILASALQSPFMQILKNAGITLNENSKWDIGHGFDSRTGRLVNMFDAGIIDAFDVVLGAVKSAIGVAAGVLTAGSVVLLPREENDIIGQISQKVAEQMSIQR